MGGQFASINGQFVPLNECEQVNGKWQRKVVAPPPAPVAPKAEPAKPAPVKKAKKVEPKPKAKPKKKKKSK